MATPRARTTTTSRAADAPAHPLAIVGAELQRALERCLYEQDHGRRPRPAAPAREVRR